VVGLGFGGLALALGLGLRFGADTKSVLETSNDILSLLQELLKTNLIKLLLGLVLLDLGKEELLLSGLESSTLFSSLVCELFVFGSERKKKLLARSAQ
jgi:hypothetical protein